MEAYRNILVPLDGSKLSESVLPEVERIASALNSHITILIIAYTEYGKKEKVIGEAEQYVNKVIKQMRNKGLIVDSFIGYALDTAKRILDYAAEYDIDLIMMSTHGYTGAKHLLFGSVAEEVVRNTTKPVLLVRAK